MADQNEKTESKPHVNQVVIGDHLEAYKALWERFTFKRHVYELAARQFKRNNFVFFVIPLLIIQAVNVIIIHFLADDEKTKDNVITITSALSAFIVALQTKLKFAEMSEQFAKVATNYSLLVSESYFRMMRSHVDAGVKSYEERCKRILTFMDESQSTENKMIADVPNVPNRIVHNVTMKMEKLKLLRAEAEELKDSDESKHANELRQNINENEIPETHKIWSDDTLKSGVNGDVSFGLRKNLVDDVTMDEYGHILKPMDVTGAFRQLWQRYYRKRMIYQVSSAAYRNMDFKAFTVPLLIFQLVNTICPTLLGDNVYALKIVTTIVAAISAAFIAIQGKLKWGEVGEKFANASKTYNELASEAYFKMIQSKIQKHMAQTENIRTTVIKFIESTRKTEIEIEAVRPIESSMVGKAMAAQIEGDILAKATDSQPGKAGDKLIENYDQLHKESDMSLVTKIANNYSANKDVVKAAIEK